MSIIMVQLRNSLGKQIKQCSSQIFDSPMWLTETCFRVCGKKKRERSHSGSENRSKQPGRRNFRRPL
uniref:Uncharacterized protein n=1 Tax=Anguilla anguilla TaxID=7936 RepID=A0A0E9VSD9_ANGAN